MLVSLISRLVACSPRIVVDKQTDRHTHRTTTVTLAAHARRGLIRKGVYIGIAKKGKEARQGYTVYRMMHRRLMIVTKRESIASLIHDTSPILRYSLQQSHNKDLYYGFRDAILLSWAHNGRLMVCIIMYCWGR